MTGAQTVLAVAGSHLYPGARGVVRGPGTEGPCLIEFADGSAAIGELGGGIAMALDIRPYTTARGTRIPAKCWKVAVSAGRFRVLARA